MESFYLHHAHRQLTTYALDLGFGIFIIWCGLERFTRLFASDGEVMRRVRLNEDWRRESFVCSDGWNLINASPRSVWGTRDAIPL